MRSRPLAVARWLRRLYLDVAEMRWRALASMLLAHSGASWAALAWVGETALTPPATFVYFYMTTATTVGYGDLSPESDGGRLLTAFFVYPGAIALFAASIGKAVAVVSEAWRRTMDGRGDFSKLTDATVIIGHHPTRTPRMIAEVQAGRDGDRPLVLMARQRVTLDDSRVSYIHADSLTDEAELTRAAVVRAARVIVYADDDEETLAAALAVAALNPRAHLVAFFKEQQAATLLGKHTRAECVVSPSVELVVRAVQDPGASQVMRALASATESATIYSLRLPDNVTVTFGAAFLHFRNRHGAIVVAALTGDGETPVLNPAPDFPLPGGAMIYFISDRRLPAQAVDWAALGAAQS